MKAVRQLINTYVVMRSGIKCQCQCAGISRHVFLSFAADSTHTIVTVTVTVIVSDSHYLASNPILDLVVYHLLFSSPCANLPHRPDSPSILQPLHSVSTSVTPLTLNPTALVENLRIFFQSTTHHTRYLPSLRFACLTLPTA